MTAANRFLTSSHRSKFPAPMVHPLSASALLLAVLMITSSYAFNPVAMGLMGSRIAAPEGTNPPQAGPGPPVFTSS
jgi:hypothetical protein